MGVAPPSAGGKISLARKESAEARFERAWRKMNTSGAVGVSVSTVFRRAVGEGGGVLGVFFGASWMTPRQLLAWPLL